MQCFKCGANNVGHAVYCAQCGTQIANSTTVSVVYKNYAGFWKRVGASIIDTILLSIVGAVLMSVLVGAFGGALLFSSDALTSVAYILTILGVGYSLRTFLSWLYFTLMESSSKQATLGKMALGIVVTDEQGKPISFLRANARYWSKILSALCFGVGYFMAAFTARKQALHDLIASTLVVDE